MSTYYLGWSDILWNNNSGLDKHIYLVKDLDGDLQSTNDQSFIRGTAENNDITDFLFGGTGSLLVEDGLLSSESRDGLDNINDSNLDGYLDNDKNKDGVADNYVDRHYTQVTITDSQWNAMLQLAADIDAAGYEYGLLSANCQAIVVSMLSLAGLDFEQNVPIASSYTDYVSRNVLLSGAGSDTLYGFDHDDRIFDRGGGDDDFYGGDATNPVRFDDSDGMDAVHYDDEDETGTLKIYDTYRIVQEGNGSTDVLYSIEKVGFEGFDESNTLDYSNYSSSVDIDSFSFVGRLAEPGDVRTAVRVKETPGGFLGFGAEVFEAINFGYFKLTDYDDKICLKSEGVAEAVTVDAGAGDDEIDVSVTGATIFAGAGEDTISRAINGTVIYTGAGDGDKDVINIFYDNVLIADAGTEDRIHFLGNELTGGFKMHISESSWTQWTVDGVRFGINSEGQLGIQTLLGKTTYVDNFQYTLDGIENDTAGIIVFELDIEAYRVLELPKGWLTSTLKAFHNLMELVFADYDAGPSDPLVLDLDGDGLEVAPNTVVSPKFDLNGDGFAERTGWTLNGDDGFVVRDINSDGVINDISEMFGNDTTSGFAALAAFDTNTDGVVDQAEATAAGIQIWKDADRDAQTDAGELVSFSDAGVSSITVTPTNTNPDNSANTGFAFLSAGEFTRTDSSTGAAYDVVFGANEYDSEWLEDVTLTAGALALPEVKGHGTLPSLRAAMSYDSGFETIVSNTLTALNTPDVDVLRSTVMPILNGWAASVSVPAGHPGTEARIDVPVLVNTAGGGDGVEVVDFGVQREDAQGTYWVLASGDDVLDAQSQVIARPTYQDILDQAPGTDEAWQVVTAEQIQFMERWLGQSMPLSMDTNAGASAVNGMSGLLDIIVNELNSVAIRIASQDGPLASFFDGVEYNHETDRFESTTDRQLAPMLEAIFAAAPGNAAGDAAHLDAWNGVLDIVIDQYDRDGDSSANTYSFLFQNVVMAYENIPLAVDIVTAAAALDIPEDLIITGSGTLNGTTDADIFYMDGSNQTVNGDEGPDSFVFGKNIGHDVIAEVDPSYGEDLDDTVRFTAHNASDMTFVRDDKDMVITITETGESIRLVDQFEGRVAALTPAYEDYATGVSLIIFANGEVWDRVDMAHAVAHPNAGDDHIQESNAINVLDGGAGNDLLEGGNQGDIYIFGQGYGQDFINDYRTDFLTTTPDFVKFNAGITQSDLIFTREGKSDDVTITIDGTTDTLTIKDQFWASYLGSDPEWFNRIEGFSFEDGSMMLWSDVIELIPQTLKTSGDDTIYGFSYEDTLDGGTGNDYLSGGDENDTYIYGLGYGHDTIEEDVDNFLSGADDQVVFLADIDPGTVTFSRTADSDDLVFTFADSGTLTIIDQFKYWNYVPFGPKGLQRIESFVFNDPAQTTWTYDYIQSELIDLSQTTGNDTIYGYDGYEDVLEGGLGDDHILGGYEGDTYIYNSGDGNDIIEDNHQNQSRIPVGANSDKLVFTDIASTNVALEWGDGEWDLKIRVLSTDETINIVDQNKRFATGSLYYTIEEVEFSDSVTWTSEQMRDLYLAGAATSGDDYIHGF